MSNSKAVEDAPASELESGAFTASLPELEIATNDLSPRLSLPSPRSVRNSGKTGSELLRSLAPKMSSGLPEETEMSESAEEMQSGSATQLPASSTTQVPPSATEQPSTTYVFQASTTEISSILQMAASTAGFTATKITEETPSDMQASTTADVEPAPSAYILQGTASNINALLQETESLRSTRQQPSVANLQQGSTMSVQQGSIMGAQQGSIMSLQRGSALNLQQGSASTQQMQSQLNVAQSVASVAQALAGAQGTVSVLLVPESQTQEQHRSMMKRAGAVLTAGTGLVTMVWLANKMN